MEKPSLPKGTRDFGPVVMAKRQFILDSIKKVFQKYGFQPLETPAMENLSTLTGKYGDEGDQLLFRITDSGDFIGDTRDQVLKVRNVENILRLNFEKFIFELIKEKKKQEFIPEPFEIDSFVESYFKNATTAEELQTMQILIDNKAEVINGVKDLIYNNLSIEEILFFPKALFTNLFGWYKAQLFSILDHKKLKISEKGLRYDLTVPFARYVVMNRHEIALPFKRYQIQPVWRADRPQKGRYREFYQCDADVVGTDSLICEAEIILMIKEVFKSLKISEYSIKINHRGILSGLAELAGAKDLPAGQAGNETALFVAIDKLDKIGEEKVKEELRTKGFDDKSLTAVFDLLNAQGSTKTKVELLTNSFSNSDKGKKGIADLLAVLELLKEYGVSEDHVEFDVSLARGLSYYTGCIFEVKINNVAIGSVSGGGRYDNLTQAFGAKEKLSGVGISFGVDRLFDAMEELKLFPEEAQISSSVLITHFDLESQRYGLKTLQTLRDNNIAAEIYPDSIKIQKQLDYANKKMIPYVIVIGSEEMKSGLLAFKNMKTGEQTKIGIEDILKTLKLAVGGKQ